MADSWWVLFFTGVCVGGVNVDVVENEVGVDDVGNDIVY